MMTWLDDVADGALPLLLDDAPPSRADLRQHRRLSPSADVHALAVGIAPPPLTLPLFVRALVAETLLEVDPDAHRARIDRAILRIERSAVADRFVPIAPLPDRPGFPPNAQEIAQLILLFARAGRRDLVVRHCVPPLAAMLPYAEADGTIPNWILPPPGAASPPETGAMADLLYAFARWDARRFLGLIVAGARRVADRQQPDGSWAGDAGPFYTGWQALRLLGAVMPNHPAVQRGIAFLHDRRRPDGSWSRGDGPDPISTASALLALAAARAPASQVRAAFVPDALLTGLRHLPGELPGGVPLAAALTLRAATTMRPFLLAD